MAVIHEILKEELERLYELQELYGNKINDLPRGSVQEKDRNGKLYSYIAYRSGDIIKYEYIGKSSSDRAAQVKGQIKKRKEFEQKLKQIRKDIKEIEKALK